MSDEKINLSFLRFYPTRGPQKKLYLFSIQFTLISYYLLFFIARKYIQVI